MPPPTWILSCNVLDREVRHFLAGQAHVRGCDFFPMGLHDQPTSLRERLQSAIDTIEAEKPEIEVIVLVYALCGQGTRGLGGRRCTLVVPKAHDCMTLYLGSRERFAACNAANHGLYWYAPGWQRERRVPGPERRAWLHEQYSRKFDEDDVEFLLEQDDQSLAPYNTAAYTDLGVVEVDAFRQHAKDCASFQGWKFQEFPGDPSLLRDLLAGAWDDQRYLIVPPGKRVGFDTGPDVMRLE